MPTTFKYLETNLYEVLGVDVCAPESVIIAAHRALIKEYHPDKTTDPQEKELFHKKTTEINLARDILTNKTERSQYDASRADRRATARRAEQAKKETENKNQTTKNDDSNFNTNTNIKDKKTVVKPIKEDFKTQDNINKTTTKVKNKETPQKKEGWFKKRPSIIKDPIGFLVWWTITVVAGIFIFSAIQSVATLLIIVLTQPVWTY